jgi:D-glycero-alpha-D-manno-heptose 1-phosphate guanylyltransferase
MMTITNITAVVLAGGLGTRLRSLVEDRPKVLAEVHHRPFIEYLLEQIMTAGIKRAVMCTGYQGEKVRAEFGNHYQDLDLLYSHELVPLGTGGALRLAFPLIASDPVLVMNGDSYFNADIRDFCNRHTSAGSMASIMLAQVENTGRYGRIEINPDGSIVRFIEKGQDIAPGWINAGIYLFSREFIRCIPPYRFISLEEKILPQCIGDKFFGFTYQGEFIDIGTPESYRQADAFMQPLFKTHGGSNLDPSAMH